MSSLADIPELEGIPKIDSVEDLLKLNEKVFSLIPHSDKLVTSSLSSSVDFFELYNSYKKASMFGWCHSNAVFLHLLLREYYRDSYVYNYGFQNLQITHAVVVVTLRDRKYLLDPYFCRHYEDRDGHVLTMDDLLDRARCRQVGNLVSVYGKSLKSIHNPPITEEWDGLRLEKSVLGSWNARTPDSGPIEYGILECLLLILNKVECSRIVKKRSGELYWEFF